MHFPLHAPQQQQQQQQQHQQHRQPVRANGGSLLQASEPQAEPRCSRQQLTEQTQSRGPCASQHQPSRRPQAHTTPVQLSAQLQQHVGAQQPRPQTLLSSAMVLRPSTATAAPLVDPHRTSAPLTSLSARPQQTPSQQTPIPARIHVR